MGFRFRPDPLIEKQIQDEAQGLMADEAQFAGWHPPMALPNTPRDPIAEEKKRKAMEILMKQGQSPASPIPASQNPFAEKVPTPEEMAQTTAALRHAQTPAAMPAMGGFQPMGPAPAPGMAQPDANEAQGVAEAETKDPDEIDLEEDGLRKMLMGGLTKGPGPEAPIPTFSNEFIESQREGNKTNNNLAFMAMMAKNANQMGQIGGKVADSSGMDQWSKQLMGQNSESMKNMSELEQLELKGRQKSKLGNDPSKLILELLKLKQGDRIAGMRNETSKEGNASRNKLAEASLAQTGEIARMASGDRRAALDLNAATTYSEQGLKGAQLEEVKRHNKAIEAQKKVDAENKKKAAKINAKGLTEGAKKTRRFVEMMERANAEFSKLEKGSYDGTNARDRISSTLGTPGQMFMSDQGKLSKQFETEFIRAKLRDESGALIGKPEFVDDANMLFPRMGDTPQVLAQKRAARANAIRAMKGQYEEERLPAKAYEAEFGESLDDEPLSPDVIVEWKGKKKTIPRSELQRAIDAGAREVN